MKFDQGIAKKYRQSVIDAIRAIIRFGNDEHRRVINAIDDSDMIFCVHPVSKVNASGITGIVDLDRVNSRISDERMSVRDALSEVFITIAEETIDTGGRRGCEGTLVHEGRHAFDYAKTISSYSNGDVNPLSQFDPNGFELEWKGHRAAAEYMLQIGKDDYIGEGLELMILKQVDGNYVVNEDGIRRRLKESYGLDELENPGKTVGENWGFVRK